MLPVDAILPELLTTLDAHSRAVLIAPPGAGKTTGVPPVLLDAAWRRDGRIIVVEPRRLAARAAAARIAALRGEEVGRTVGYRVRNDTTISAVTRIELVTAGVFVRMILDDPGLDGIAAILFDEVHERALDVDLGLALALEAQGALREDLRLLAMSATLDGRRFVDLFGGAPVVESEGRLHAVETSYLGSEPGARVEDRVARAVLKGLAEEEGSILAFLPGQGEISRTVERLAERLPADTDLAPLYGALDARAQDLAIRPAAPGRRKVVLATSIAETSLTIEGVRLVVDSGLSRRPRYEPGSGLTRLETVRASRAAADQRRGRAGRTEPGVCYRLWDEPQTASLQPFDTPEILAADLADLALTLLAWGAADPSVLRWLDAPPAAAYAEALDLLTRLGARDKAGGLTSHGRRLAELPLPPRLAHMLLQGAASREGRLAADIAAILSEPGLGGRDTDLPARLESFRRDRGPRARASRDAAARWAAMAERLTARDDALPQPPDAATLLALAYPERLAQQRGGRGRFRMANGSGARLDGGDPLADAQFLAIGEVQGGGPDGRILLAARTDRETIEAVFADRIVEEERLDYDSAADGLRAVRLRRLDALVLRETPIEVPRDERAAMLLADAVARRGLASLPWPEDIARLRERVGFLRRHDPSWPDLSDEALVRRREEWLLPMLQGKRRLGDPGPRDIRDAFAALLPWARMAELDRLAPPRFEAPSGTSAAIDYAGEEPVVRIRVQNLFGLATHPGVMDGRVPILLELLSPAQRPLQVTRDLPGFWAGSWRDVRADMRGRYPKHAWPEDPATAAPLKGTKRQG
ncbi:ATP-dependent helicase HrpB [Lutibaculum baratangense]|uniref:ATP-dependent helicase HrpB n=1 Tax=Lutibaculum baratangense AMV1 TaxID=631454 RepID=V4T7Y0_9HYPH|nr:ATP-dependent helicase HrpB [Lutibaculum baratangense]ESR22713.1 ATP-dependent helicase HrpB [Lutibaculum baratangense AMV1]